MRLLVWDDDTPAVIFGCRSTTAMPVVDGGRGLTAVARRNLIAAPLVSSFSQRTIAKRCRCVSQDCHGRSLACVLRLHLQLLLLRVCTDRNACSAVGPFGCRQRSAESRGTLATALSRSARLQASLSAGLKEQIIAMNGGRPPSVGQPHYELFCEFSQNSEGTADAAAVKQDAGTATDAATCAPAGDGQADSSTPVSQDKHAGDSLMRTVPPQCPAGLPYCLSLACSLAPYWCRVGRHCTLHLVDNDGRCTAGHPGSPPQTGGPVVSRTCGAKCRAEAEASAPVCHSRLSFGSLCVFMHMRYWRS